MTTTSVRAVRRVPTELWSFWVHGRPVERTAYAVGAALIVSGLFHLGVYAVLGGPWEGPVSWRKPVTFGLSFGITLITLAWVTSYLQLSPSRRRLWLGLLTAASIGEVALITLQGWRHRPSHFDMETAVDTAIARSLAVGGAVLIVVVLALAVAAFRSPAVSPGMTLAIRAGFVALVTSMLAGGVMIAVGVALTVAGHQQEAYATGGFLKPLHAVTLHGILVLPGLAWLAGLVGADEAAELRLVRYAVGVYAAAAAGALALSLAGL
jgi:hypothetical protein